MLRLQLKDKQGEPILLDNKRYRIGSAPSNHLVLTAPGVDPLHAQLISSDSGKVYVKDNASQSGTYVNGQPVTHKQLSPGDSLRVGDIEISILGVDNGEPPWQLVASGSWLNDQVFSIPSDRAVIIGRAEDCDIMIAGTHLSRHHVELSVAGQQLRVRDLNSANGTFLDEQPITEALAHEGDRLRIDVYSFHITRLEADSDKAQARVSLDEIKAITPKLPRTGPRRWKTRPTSPGNRIEPTDSETTPKQQWLWFSFGFLALGLLLLWLWLW